MAVPGDENPIARRVLDDLLDFSGEETIDGRINFFKSQQIPETRGFINRMRDEATTIRNLIGQMTALIAEVEAEDGGGHWDTLMDLRAKWERANVKLRGLNVLINNALEEVADLEEEVGQMDI